MKLPLLFFTILFPGYALFYAQVDLGGLVKEKARQAQQKAKDKAFEKSSSYWENQRKAYDESNFNYAICFLDNSSLFESEEKGNALAGSLFSGTKKLAGEEKSPEERAYTNLKNGELLLAGNKYYLAEQSFKLAKFQYEQSASTQSSNYAQTISNLGLLYQIRGRFTSARPFHEKALELRKHENNKDMLLVSQNNYAVWKKETGRFTEAEYDLKAAIEQAKALNNQLALALLQNNLALTYADMNKLKEAEALMLKALTEAGKVLDPTTANFIKLRINLADIYRLEKKYREAEEIYLSCINSKEKKLGAHPDLAQLKKGLAQVYMDMGKSGEVEKLLNSALDINTRKLGPNNPATVATLHELANFHRFNGEALKALEEMNKVMERYTVIYGEKHPAWIQAKEDLALCQWQNNTFHAAAESYAVVINSTLQFIRDFFSSLNENEKTKYWDKTSNRLQRYYSFVSKHAAQIQPDPLPEFYQTIIATKGFLINTSSRIRSAIMESQDEGLKQIYNQWLETKEALNLAYQLSKEELREERLNVDSLQQSEEQLERKLSEKSDVFRSGHDAELVPHTAIQSQLSAQEAVIEFLELNEYANGFTGKQAYLALVLKKNEIKQVLIGPAEEVHRAISSFRENVLNLKEQGNVYQSLWKNIDPVLAGIKTLYISLDGQFHQLSLAAIKNEKKEYLADRYNLVFLGNSRDLVSFKAKPVNAKPKNAFLAGNPKYGANALIEQLPGAEKEVLAISDLMGKYKIPVKSLTGEKATEQALKSLQSPGILHLATHGFFLSDLSEVQSDKVLGIELGAAKENPLLRSGLLMADCENVFDEQYRAMAGKENGILTAYEVMGMPLDKTELVVLSACETGLGDVKQGEGVYGLQRAFLIAGAQCLVMSLWSVSDEATMHLMNTFYSNYLKSGDKVKAFQEAQRQLKTRYPEPFYWSAFMMLNR